MQMIQLGSAVMKNLHGLRIARPDVQPKLAKNEPFSLQECRLEHSLAGARCLQPGSFVMKQLHFVSHVACGGCGVEQEEIKESRLYVSCQLCSVFGTASKTRCGHQALNPGGINPSFNGRNYEKYVAKMPRSVVVSGVGHFGHGLSGRYRPGQQRPGRAKRFSQDANAGGLGPKAESRGYGPEEGQ
jgi:hypothetical protein